MHAGGVEGIGIMAKATPEFFETLNHFEAWEFDHPYELDELILGWLDDVREEAGTAMVPTSDYRPGDPRAHGKGWAVDIACASSHKRFKILEAVFRLASTLGITIRIGIYDKHIHFDVADQYDPENYPSDVVWWGTSR